MARIVVCEGVLRGRAHELAAALHDAGLDATYVDPFTSPAATDYTFAALADAFGDDAGTVAVGGSLASAAALAFARHRPERCAALVLLHPVVLFGRRADLADLGAAVRSRGTGAVWRALYGEGAAVPQHDDEVVAAALTGLGDDVLLEAPDDLARVGAPTLVIASAGDPLHAMEVATAYWRLIPTTRLINETPGDVALWDRPADLADRIGRFLREVDVS